MVPLASMEAVTTTSSSGGTATAAPTAAAAAAVRLHHRSSSRESGSSSGGGGCGRAACDSRRGSKGKKLPARRRDDGYLSLLASFTTPSSGSGRFHPSDSSSAVQSPNAPISHRVCLTSALTSSLKVRSVAAAEYLSYDRYELGTKKSCHIVKMKIQGPFFH